MKQSSNLSHFGLTAWPRRLCRIVCRAVLICLLGLIAESGAGDYPWLSAADPAQALDRRIPVPMGYERVPAEQGSFHAWLRQLPLKAVQPPVYLHNGRPKARQDVHVAIVDIDVGNRDLQQCADAIMRLRAEFLFSRAQYAAIRFNFTSGHTVSFLKWTQGVRPKVQGNSVIWTQGQPVPVSHQVLRAYLTKVFTYAGTHSLSREMLPVKDIRDMRIGDVFIEGGFPGHAVIVVDMAYEPKSGRKIFALAQSYMPAQDIHVLRNPAQREPNPWYALEFGDTLNTPEWTFQRTHLKRFVDHAVAK
ncbi:MAG: DUF4846 domain-containing protein [Thermodesulfobacteriota bacterium]